MFTKSLFAAVSVLALAGSQAVATPLAVKPETELARRTSFPSFNNYMGFSSMSNFDDFNGISNFDGSFNEQIIIEEETVIVCESVSIDIIQQRLVVMSEIVKEIILEQICEVEVQEIVLEQFMSYFFSFSESILHVNDISVSFDSEIVSFYDQIFESDGSLSSNDFGFSGSSVGSHSVQVSGNNWVDSSSPTSVLDAKNLANTAYNCSDCSS